MTNATEGLFQSEPQDGKPAVEGEKPDSSEKDQSQGALAMLVGEGRKYKTVEDLAKAYINADQHIGTLESDNASLKEQVAKGKTVDEVLERLEQDRQRSGDDKSHAQSISVADIAKIVEAQITGRETAKAKNENIAKAQALLVQKFGDKAKEVFLAAADTKEKLRAMNELAAVSPDLFAQLFSTSPDVRNATDGSNKGKEATGQTATGRAADPDCKEYYDEMRRKDPRKFYSQSVQLEMHKRALANPTKFKGR